MSRSVTGISSESFAAVYNNISTYPSLQDISNEIGMTIQQIKRKAAGLRGHAARGYGVPELIMRPLDLNMTPKHGDVEIEHIESPEEPMQDLLNRVLAHNDRKAEYAERRKLIDLNVHIGGPFGIVGLPDQHLNNPGTQLRKALDDAALIRNTEGLYCVAVGDWLDNFIIGRLERERRNDVMTHTDANRIQEFYLELIADKLLAAIGGNHNDWIGMLGGTDVLGSLFKRLNKNGIYDGDEIRIRINTPSGRSFIHLVRHIFPGHSKYNTAHGVLSWMLDRWQGEDVLWGGHIHSSAHVAIEREHLGEVKVVHGVQLSSYKTLDHYAVARGFRKNSPFIAPMIVHDPADGSTVFFEDIEKGVAYLKALRAGVM